MLRDFLVLVGSMTIAMILLAAIIRIIDSFTVLPKRIAELENKLAQERRAMDVREADMLLYRTQRDEARLALKTAIGGPQ